MTDVAYYAIEKLFSTLELVPGSPVVESDLIQRTGLGTPVREALLRMVSSGLIVQQPRRGLLVSHIDLADHLDVIQTRRVLEILIAGCSARRATAAQRREIVDCAQRMVQAAARDSLDDYMRADHELDLVNHQASHNKPAVHCVVPLIVQCRRFWYAISTRARWVRAHGPPGIGRGYRQCRRGRGRAGRRRTARLSGALCPAGDRALRPQQRRSRACVVRED